MDATENLYVVFFFFFLCVVAQVTETRTGPLGCSNYDNLDSVSSVLVQSPENKVQLQGLSDFNYFYCDFNVMFIWGSNNVLYGICRGIQKVIKCIIISASHTFAVTPRVYSLMAALNPACFYRLAGDPSGLLEGKFCAGCSQLHSLQWRGRVWLQGQWLLVQLWPQVPRVQLPLYGHPSHGGEPGEDHGDVGDLL